MDEPVILFFACYSGGMTVAILGALLWQHKREAKSQVRLPKTWELEYYDMCQQARRDGFIS